jgi:hypothetical protein
MRDEEPVCSEFVSLISLWCRVLIFPKYHVWKNVVITKLSIIVLYLLEKSPEEMNCGLARMSPRRWTKKVDDCLSKRVVSWEWAEVVVGESCEIVWRKNYPRVQEQHFYEKELSESPDERYLCFLYVFKFQQSELSLSENEWCFFYILTWIDAKKIGTRDHGCLIHLQYVAFAIDLSFFQNGRQKTQNQYWIIRDIFYSMK